MANFLNSVNPSNFGLNVAGNFNNLASSGTFPLPNTDLLRKINSKTTARPSPPLGSVQVEKDNEFYSNPNIYIRDAETFSEVERVNVLPNGTGYTLGPATTVSIDGTGQGLTLEITVIGPLGQIFTAQITNGGSGYKVGEQLRIEQPGSNNNAVATVQPLNRIPQDNRFVIDSSGGQNGIPNSGLVLVPPASTTTVSPANGVDGAIAYFDKFQTNEGYNVGDFITLSNPNGGVPAVIYVCGFCNLVSNAPPVYSAPAVGVNGNISNFNSTTIIVRPDPATLPAPLPQQAPGEAVAVPGVWPQPGTNYQVGDKLTAVSVSPGLGRFYACVVTAVGANGEITGFVSDFTLIKDFQGFSEGRGWQSFTSQGGVATAAGANTQIQFNNNGSLGADPSLTFDVSTTPPVLKSGLASDPSVNIFTSTVFEVTDTEPGVGTSELLINSSNFATPLPAVNLEFEPAGSGNINGAITLTTDFSAAGGSPADSFAGIDLLTFAGEIRLKSQQGPILLSTDSSGGSLSADINIEVDRPGGLHSGLYIGAAPNVASGIGDIALLTEEANNEIRLITKGLGSDMLLQTNTNGSNISIQAGAGGTTNQLLLSADTKIEATHGDADSLDVTNTSGNGSKIQMMGAGVNNIVLTGDLGQIKLGGDGVASGEVLIIDNNTDESIKLFSNNPGGEMNINYNNGLTALNAVALANGGKLTINTISGGATSNAIILDNIRSTAILRGVDGLGNDIDVIKNQGKPEQRFGFSAGGNTGGAALYSGISSVVTGGLIINGTPGYLGNPSTVYTTNPQPDANLILGQYGWGTVSGSQPNQVDTSWKNVQTAIGYGGSGNVYCNIVRENPYYWMPTQAIANGDPNSVTNGRTWGGSSFNFEFPPQLVYPTGQGSHVWGYNGNFVNRGWYNNGNIRTLVVDVGGSVNGSTGANSAGAAVNGFFTPVTLPPINEAMVGMRITVTRARVAPHNPNGAEPGAYTTKGTAISNARIEFHKIAVCVKADGQDLISGPDSVILYDAGLANAYVALDPYRVLVPYPNGTGASTSGFRGNPQINKWTVVFSSPQTINTSEFPRDSTTNAVPGVTIIQKDLAGTDVFYGTLVEVNKDPTDARDVLSMVFTSPATNGGTTGVYNFVASRDLYIGGYWNGATNNVSGGQVISSGDISAMNRVNLGAAPLPNFPQSAGFPAPYTSISSATFQAMAGGNGMRNFGANPSRYVWQYVDEYPAL